MKKIINEDALYAKRPGTGIAPDKIELVLGKKALNDIPADTVIMSENIDELSEI